MGIYDQHAQSDLDKYVQACLKSILRLPKTTEGYFIFYFSQLNLVMLQLNRAISNKFFNQLAHIEEVQRVQQQVKVESEHNRLKMKCLNQLARTDESFKPSIISQKSLATTLTSPHTLTKQTSLQPSLPLNPEVIEIIEQAQAPEKECAPVLDEENPLEKSIIVRIGSEYAFGDQDKVYCLQCDQNGESDTHSCRFLLNTLGTINKRLSDLLILVEISKCDRFSILTEGAQAAKTSNQIILIINLLKKTSLEHNRFELLLRKRLINLCSKKLGLLLQKQDDE